MMPTTVQSPLPKSISWPMPAPGYRRAMLLPTTSSRLPGSNIRPWTTRHCSRISNPIGISPRTVTFIPPGASGLSSTTTVTISSEAIGSPRSFRAMPGRSLRSWNHCRVMMLVNSAVAPRLTTSTCSGFPVAASDVRSPSTKASTASSTATVSAMPSAVITVVVLRSIRLRML